MRVSIFVVIAFALAGSLGGAAAQSYPPPPAYYTPPPPGYYPPPPPGYYQPPRAYPLNQPQPYSSAPLPPLDVGAQATEQPSSPYRTPTIYRDANGASVEPYGPGADEQAGEGPPGGYPPAGPPYFTPADRTAAQPQPSLGRESIPRPPADVTGTIGNPPESAAGPEPDRATVVAALPPEDQPEGGPAKELAPQLRRQLVDYVTSEPAGTVIVDTPHTYLFLVLGGGKALRYGIGVGREGFTWSGSERISRMTEWPDWHPPKEMIERQPYLPRFMAGGEGNPLGARALHLGNTLYRIHGTNQPSTIGTFVSSGCIRLTNADIEDLYGRVNLGTRVVVVSGSPATSASAPGPVAR
ncbi:MAG TPA: L,D-transpeptidase [Xanthobacteraceae bacterium]|nr:L,D-transpeptidase [Xanthobacteraceae bacterium]